MRLEGRAASIIGTFASVEEPADVTFDVAYTASEMIATVTGVTVSAEPDVPLPETFDLHQAYPNPFNPQTVIPYDLASTSRVRLAVYDLLGREVALLVDGIKKAGRHEALFNANDLASSVYLIRLEAGRSFTETRHVTLQR